MYKRDVLLPYAGFNTIFRAPQGDFIDLKPGDVAVVGVPWDITGLSRQGTRFGPAAIRQTSSVLSTWFENDAPTDDLINLDTGLIIKTTYKARLLDLGDLNLYPTDIQKTSRSISDGVAEIVRKSAFPVILGGDHYITYPAFRGVAEALGERGKKPRLGYLQLDAHFDLERDNTLMGKYNNGTMARRISEMAEIRPENMVWVGPRGYAVKENIDWANSNGATFITALEVARRGIKESITRAIEAASKGTDGIYITIDIDVVDPTMAPGNGAIAFGGITPMELLEAVELLKEAPAVAFDIVEVAPKFDPTGVTERLAAQAVLNFVAPRVFAD
ncbi:agmatinase family protein [Mesorhizobium sp. M0244]|uniref:agmatinase family protein n=1 Tax=Mesorhizobium sp. M0244 TaxID=2956926 RepID=UPI0033360C9D